MIADMPQHSSPEPEGSHFWLLYLVALLLLLLLVVIGLLRGGSLLSLLMLLSLVGLAVGLFWLTTRDRDPRYDLEMLPSETLELIEPELSSWPSATISE